MQHLNTVPNIKADAESVAQTVRIDELFKSAHSLLHHNIPETPIRFVLQQRGVHQLNETVIVELVDHLAVGYLLL